MISLSLSHCRRSGSFNDGLRSGGDSNGNHGIVIPWIPWIYSRANEGLFSGIPYQKWQCPGGFPQKGAFWAVPNLGGRRHIIWVWGRMYILDTSNHSHLCEYMKWEILEFIELRGICTWKRPIIQWVITEDLYGCFHWRDGRDGSWIFLGYFLCCKLRDCSTPAHAETRIFHPGKKTQTICWCLVVTSTILTFHPFQDPLRCRKSLQRNPGSKMKRIKDSLLTPFQSHGIRKIRYVQWHRATAYNNKVKLTETSFTISVFDTLSLSVHVII